jgi:hypothetical protein
MRMTFVKSLSLLAGLVLVMVLAPITYQSVSGQANPCGMQMNQMQVIFCDTFSSPFPITNRAGQLNGVVWGASRMEGGGPYWNAHSLVHCDGPRVVVPPNDIAVCNGRLRVGHNDNGSVTSIALYPKQPFDFTGRTGTVSFDVTNDTSGMHGAWPEFWLTDQPVPVPFVHGSSPCDFCSLPRNGFGLRFGAAEGTCPGGWRTHSIVVVNNYSFSEHGIFDGPGSGTRIQENGCARMSSGPNGTLNHVELRISQNRIEVWASDAGSTSLRLVNTITNANLPVTRGLIWIGDAHYNANKSGVRDDSTHTYTWDNVAFDGPATYRDLSFDVLDRMQPIGTGVNGQARYNLGWDSSPSSPAQVQTLPMTAANIAGSASALLMFNYGLFSQISSFNYNINGQQFSAPSPVMPSARGMRSVALNVPLTALVAGPQTIRLSGNNPMVVGNVNIVLVNAAPVPGVGPVPTAPQNLRIIGLVFNKVETWAGLLQKALPQ